MAGVKTRMGLHVCLVCGEYPPDTVGGGIGTYSAALARGLAKTGHRVSVIARAVRGRETVHREDGIVVHRVLPLRTPGLRQVFRRFGGKTFADAYLFARAVAAKVANVTAGDGVQIVESPEHGAEGFMLAKRCAHVPHVVRFHTPLFLVNEAIGRKLSVGGRIVDVMERTTARRAVLTTSPSRDLAEIVASRFDIPLARIRVVPNCIDHETFHPAAHPPSGEPTVLYAGKVAPRKGIAVLAEAIPLIVRRVPQVRIVVVGSDHPTATGTGSSKQEMLERLTQAGVASRVTILPPTDRAGLVRLYHGAHVFVQPSLWENFPYTSLEAMACGVPVVASAVGGLKEIIEDGKDGVLVPAHDAARLADAVATLLEQPERLLEMRQAARRKILTHYTIEQLVAETLAVYEEAIASFPTNGGDHTPSVAERRSSPR